MKNIFLLFMLTPLFMRAQTITTFAGTGSRGYSGDGGPAAAAELNAPDCVAFDAAGNMYIADDSNYVVRKVTPAGIISTYAGNGTSGFSGDGGPATAAQFNVIQSLATDAAGNLYITDGYNSRVRKVDPSGIISTFAGNGLLTSTGDGGPATSASIAGPNCVAVDPAGNVYITDYLFAKVRKVNTSGIISTVAGSAFSGFGGDGGPATLARIDAPTGVAADAAGNIYIMDSYNYRIRKISPSGIITTIAGSGYSGYTGDGGPATAARFKQSQTITLDGHGNLYFADFYNNVIRKVHLSSGIISTVAGNGIGGFSGDGGPATACQLGWPAHIAFDAAENAYIAEFWNNRIRKVSGMFLGMGQETLQAAGVAVYPNPVSYQLTVSAGFRITDISIADIMGRVIYRGQFNENEAQIETTGMSPGVYFVKINDLFVARFVKQ